MSFIADCNLKKGEYWTDRLLKIAVTPIFYLLNPIVILPYLIVLPLEGASLLVFYILEIFRRIPGVKWLEKTIDSATISLARKIMKDERDYPLLKVALTITPLVVGSFIWQLLLPEFSWGLAVVYYILLFGPRKLDFYFHFFACKHVEAHRLKGLYKEPYSFLLDRYFEWFLGIFYGNIPEMERCAHVGIHHAENNNDRDNLSTLQYDRTNLFHFLKYVLHNCFWHNSGVGPLVYFYKNQKWKLFRQMAAGFIFFYGISGVFLAVDWRFALVYLVLPHLTHNALNAFLNWTWHIFSDPDRPENYYASAITLIEDEDDFLFENYHLSHHLNPSRHWSENGLHFQQQQDLYREKEAMVFRNINLKDLFVLTTRSTRLEILAKSYVDLSNKLSHEQIVELLKKRASPLKSQHQRQFT